MKKIFQLVVTIALCLSFTSNIYAIDSNDHKITTNQPHIVLSPNQAGDELTITLHLSQEMNERQISSMHLSLVTSSSIKDYKNVFVMNEALMNSVSLSDYDISENSIDILLANKGKLFNQQEIVLGTVRIDSDQAFEIKFTPEKIDYVYVSSDIVNTATFDCPTVILSSSGNDSDEPSVKPNPDDKFVVETVIEQLGGNKLELSEESKEVVQTSVMNYLNKNFSEVIENLPASAVIKVQLALKNLTVNDLTDEQKAEIKNVLEDGVDILAYYDISILATAYDGDEIISSLNGIEINNLEAPIKLSLNIPSEYIKNNRQFGIVRLHNDKAIGLKSTVETGNTITFETDQFSIYTLVAKDYSQEEVNKNPDILNTLIVKTGDESSSLVPFVTMAVSLVVIIGVIGFKKRDKKNK